MENSKRYQKGKNKMQIDFQLMYTFQFILTRMCLNSSFVNIFPKSTLNFWDMYKDRIRNGIGVRIFDYFWILGGSVYNEIEGM